MGKRFVLLLLATLLGAAAPSEAVAQDRRISGVVRSAPDQPIPAAEVSIVGSARSPVLTDEQGRFSISVPAGEARLEVRAFGYSRGEIVVPANQSAVEITLSQDVFNLDELVVTGQATSVERRSATTSIAYVSGEDIDEVPVPSVLNALTGKITGVNLQTNSGAPGGGIQMQVRGNSTLLGGFDPLYVVDGIIYSNASIPSGRGYANAAASVEQEADAVNRIADLNPADIASIEVLKGAAASSIYGSKASNGVVVITTKRGQPGAPSVNLTQRIGYSAPLKLLDTRVWTRDAAIAAYGDGAADYFNGQESIYYDNFAEVYGQRDLSYETLADVRGGTEDTRYYVAGALKRESGTEHNTGAGMQSLRANVDQRLGDDINVQFSSAYTRNENDRGWNNNCNNYGCHGYALAYIPGFLDLRVKNDDGTYREPPFGPQSNPLQLTELGVNHEETNRFTGGVNVTWDAWQSDQQSLRVVGGGGLDTFDQANNVWSPNDLFFERNQALPGEAIESGGRSLFWNWNANAIHTWTTDAFTATSSAGIQYEDRRLSIFSIRTQNLLPGERNVNRGTNTTVDEELTQERTIALYFQEGVNLFDNRLLLQAGLRAERSSVNGDTDKYFVFPKAAGSYRFIDLLGAGSEVKIRAAYGETGNQPLFGQKFTTLATPQLGGQQGLIVSTVSGWDQVEPERLKEFEGGIDGFLMDGRLTWELTGFTRNTTNLLLQRVPAPSSGFTTQIFNGGKIQNQGIEASLGYTPIATDDAMWVTRGTFTRYTSEVVDLAGLPAFYPTGSGFGNLGRTRIEVGKPITQLVGYSYENGELSDEPVQLGNTAPDFRVGWVNDVSYGPVSINAVLDWQQGGDVINLSRYLMDSANNSEDFGTEAFEARRVARAAGSIQPYIEDATFVKLREVAVMFNVNPDVLGPLQFGAQSLSLGLVGRNLAMWTDYSGLDPEVANFGAQAVRSNLDIAPYPPSRSFYFSVSLGF
ncbi:MAG: SusC/RagA family TonB-linked outer membrane protein [Longimicrobiales bacterium]